MMRDDDWKFEVVVNQKPDVMSFAGAWKLLWTHSIGWVVRAGFYRYRWEGHGDAVELSATELSAPALRFGLKLHQHRAGHPVIASDFTRSQVNSNPPSKNAFTAWPARWRVHVYKAIPEELRNERIPFERVPVPATDDEPPFGYQMRPGVTCILVLDVVERLKRQGAIFDWARFQRPWEPDGDRAA